MNLSHLFKSIDFSEFNNRFSDAEQCLIAAENHRFRGDVPDVNLMNRLQPIPFFIVAGFLLPMLLK
jgi:hypothetical protein